MLTRRNMLLSPLAAVGTLLNSSSEDSKLMSHEEVAYRSHHLPESLVLYKEHRWNEADKDWSPVCLKVRKVGQSILVEK